MKRIGFLVVIALTITAAAFAQNYTVESVTGRVQREAGNSRVNVVVGDILTADTVIHTGVGASLTLKSGDNSFTIAAARNGKVSELTTAASGVRIGGNITRVETDAASRTTAQVSTASARASDAAADDDIAAE
jgi:hypothetical protein